MYINVTSRRQGWTPGFMLCGHWCTMFYEFVWGIFSFCSYIFALCVGYSWCFTVYSSTVCVLCFIRLRDKFPLWDNKVEAEIWRDRVNSSFQLYCEDLQFDPILNLLLYKSAQTLKQMTGPAISTNYSNFPALHIIMKAVLNKQFIITLPFEFGHWCVWRFCKKKKPQNETNIKKQNK